MLEAEADSIPKQKQSPRTRELRRFFGLFLCSITLTIALYYIGLLVTESYEKIISLDQSIDPMDSFHNGRPLKLQNEALLYQFGLDDHKSDLIPLGHDVFIETEGLSPGADWLAYPYPWHFVGNRLASLTIRFPSNSHQRIGLFFADGNGEWRIVRVQSEKSDDIVDELFRGKWLQIKLSEAERKSGVCRIRLESLMGPGVAISALILK
jgi:hypothetical protein